VAVISIVLDAPENVISALAGKIGMLPQVKVQTMYSKGS
jgi:nitrate reductase NapAB chaperone NapD